MAFAEGLAWNITKGIAVCLVLSQLYSVRKKKNRKPASFGTFVPAFASYFLLVIFTLTWSGQVTRIVPDPYLDEVFHIPQTQKYCQGKWLEWDDKITTPPGLYLIGALAQSKWVGIECSTEGLRSLNNAAVFAIVLLAWTCRSAIEQRFAAAGADSQPYSFYAYHTAFNVALFPVVFFFSSLFYTDVWSTLVVLACYQNHLSRLSYKTAPPLWSDLCTIALGIASLAMRQTNIFWAAIYMGGMGAVHAVEALKPAEKVPAPHFATLAELVRFYGWRYAMGDIHNPPLQLAWPDDWALCLLSIAVAALANPVRVVRQIWPHITILGLFAGFVYWNGGVVLGDKSNHVATLHLAQMLYIWPFFVFFSAPLFLPYVVCIAGQLSNLRFSVQTPQLNRTAARVSAAQRPPEAVQSTREKSSIKEEGESRLREPTKSKLLTVVDLTFSNKWYYAVYVLASLAITLAIVRCNTIIHPFTLADNRHYMFYVFRRTILQPGLIRYLLVPVYAICSRMCWQLLFGCWNPRGCARNFRTGSDTADASAVAAQAKYINSPFVDARMRSMFRIDDRGEEGAPGTSKQPQQQRACSELLGTLDEAPSTSAVGPATSTALLWLVATALSLVTAPLVEPRYFILPWVFWRLLVPAWPAHECVSHDDKPDAELGRVPVLGWLFRTVGKKIDVRLLLETAWFIAINVATMYAFLHRPFYWRAADGSLTDGGKLQRFMW